MENQTNNQSEKPASSNYYGPIYFSREDQRVFVPKRLGYGLTLNFARPMAYAWLGFLLGVPALVIGVILATKL